MLRRRSGVTQTSPQRLQYGELSPGSNAVLRHLECMTSTTDQSTAEAAPLRLIEPDLAAWAERIAVDSAARKPRIWYGAALFWLVVTCIIAARVMFLDLSNFR